MTDRLLTECYPWLKLQKEAGEWRAEGDANARYGERLAGSALTEQGVTGGWAYDGETLVVENDALGFLPLFIAQSEQSFIVAPSPLVIAALCGSTQLDPYAYAFFLKFGYFIGEDTPFEGVKGLAPGSRIIWRDGAIEQSNTTICAPAPVDISREEALDQYNALFAQSMARRRPLPGANALIPLSGGRDSRHIAFEAAKQWPELAGAGPGAQFTAVTGALWRGKNTDTPEALAAARVAAHIGMAHEKVPAVRNIIANETRKNLLSGFCCDEASLISGLISQTPQPGCIYDGIGGDVLSDGEMCQPVFDDCIEKRDIDGLIELFHAFDDSVSDAIWPLISPLTGGSEKPSTDTYVTKRFESELNRYRDFRSPAVAHFLFTRTRREISLAPFLLWGAADRAYAPFIDYGLVMFLSALPAEYFCDGTFHSDAIAKAYPGAAAIPFGDSGAEPSRAAKVANMIQVVAASIGADPHRPIAGARASFRFFWRYFRTGGRGANWRLLNLMLQVVKTLREGPSKAGLGARDPFSFSHDTRFEPRDAPRIAL